MPWLREDVWDPLARRLFRLGVRPNHLTLAQAPIAVAQLWTGVQGELGWFFAAVAIGTVLDNADGVLARRTGSVTRSGERLDAAFDVVGIAIVLVVSAARSRDAAIWCAALAGMNVVLHWRSARCGRKGVPTTRGPVVSGLMLDDRFPGALLAGVWLALAAGLAVLAWRPLYWSGITMPKPHRQVARLPPSKKSHT
jgi:phosphatidylglycerophosphate synthase